jgi:uncharacterized surface protein with fasciclin (FAS1) repeats
MKSTINLKRLFLLFGLGAFLTFANSSCKKDEAAPATPNIVQLAQSDPTLTILVSAVIKAGLVDFLSNTANLTVFAPTNQAFIDAGYPQATIDALTPAQVTSILTPILTYHVVGAKVLAANVPASDTVKTQNGKNLFASKNANGVFLNGIKVTNADLNASNGVVHKIGSVLVPPTQTIAQIVAGNPSFSLLLTAVVRAGLAGALSGAGKFTVFAPVNSGFPASLDTDGEINAAPVADVLGIVGAHAFGTNIFAGDLTNGNTGATLNPLKTLTINTTPVTVKLTGSANAASNVTTANVVATNGVVHIIDKVLL